MFIYQPLFGVKPPGQMSKQSFFDMMTCTEMGLAIASRPNPIVAYYIPPNYSEGKTNGKCIIVASLFARKINEKC